MKQKTNMTGPSSSPCAMAVEKKKSPPGRLGNDDSERTSPEGIEEESVNDDSDYESFASDHGDDNILEANDKETETMSKDGTRLETTNLPLHLEIKSTRQGDDDTNERDQDGASSSISSHLIIQDTEHHDVIKDFRRESDPTEPTVGTTSKEETSKSDNKHHHAKVANDEGSTEDDESHSFGSSDGGGYVSASCRCDTDDEDIFILDIQECYADSVSSFEHFDSDSEEEEVVCLMLNDGAYEGLSDDATYEIEYVSDDDDMSMELEEIEVENEEESWASNENTLELSDFNQSSSNNSNSMLDSFNDNFDENCSTRNNEDSCDVILSSCSESDNKLVTLEEEEMEVDDGHESILEKEKIEICERGVAQISEMNTAIDVVANSTSANELRTEETGEQLPPHVLPSVGNVESFGETAPSALLQSITSSPCDETTSDEMISSSLLQSTSDHKSDFTAPSTAEETGTQSDEISSSLLQPLSDHKSAVIGTSPVEESGEQSTPDGLAFSGLQSLANQISESISLSPLDATDNQSMSDKMASVPLHSISDQNSENITCSPLVNSCETTPASVQSLSDKRRRPKDSRPIQLLPISNSTKLQMEIKKTVLSKEIISRSRDDAAMNDSEMKHSTLSEKRDESQITKHPKPIQLLPISNSSKLQIEIIKTAISKEIIARSREDTTENDSEGNNSSKTLERQDELEITKNLKSFEEVAPISNSTKLLMDIKKTLISKELINRSQREDIENISESNISKFWGRRDELKLLRRSMKRIENPSTASRSELIWISGSPGVGKSALLSAFTRNIPETTIVCQGSFEQRVFVTKPYSGVVQCLTDLVNYLVRDSKLKIWKVRLKKGLGDDGQLLATIIPGLLPFLDIEDDDIITKQKKAFKFTQTSHRMFHRLRFAIRRFLETVSLYQSVVIILDDLQWASNESLQMVETCFSSLSLNNLLFVGCHREIVKNSSHPLSLIKAKLSMRTTADIRLENLDEKNCLSIISSYLKTSTVRDLPVHKVDVEFLSRILFRKTSGNPLFLVQLVQHLKDHRLINHDGIMWECKWTRLVTNERYIPATASDLITRRIVSLPKMAKVALRGAACLGLRSFQVETVYRVLRAFQKVSKRSESSDIPDIETVEGLFNFLSEKLLCEKVSPGHYRFSHDVVKTTAFSLLPMNRKQKALLHFRAGIALSRLCRDYKAPCQTEEMERLKLLESDQLSRATEVIEDDKKWMKLAELKLDVAERALAKAAFIPATVNLDAGLSYLNKSHCWSKSYDVTLKLYLNYAKAKYCCGAVEEAKRFADVTIANAKSIKDKVGAYQVLLWILRRQNKLAEAFKMTMFVLKELGEDLPTEVTPRYVTTEVGKMMNTLKKKSDSELLELSNRQRKKSLHKMFFLAELSDISWTFRDTAYHSLATTRMMKLILRHGSSEFSGLAFSLFAVCLARSNRHSHAHRYGRLALKMAKQDSFYDGDALVYNYYMINHWRGSPVKGLEPVLQTVKSCINAGCIEKVSFRAGAYIANFLVSGTPLTLLDPSMSRFQVILPESVVPDNWFVAIPYEIIIKLKENSKDLAPISENYIQVMENGSERAVEYLHFMGMVLHFLSNDMAGAEDMRKKLTHCSEGVWVHYHAFVEGMIAISLMKSRKGKPKSKLYKKANKIIKQMEKWVMDGVTLCEHMVEFLKAEMLVTSARKRLSDGYVRLRFDAAIASAAKGGFLHHEALANERAGRYFLDANSNRVASVYFTQAWEAYRRWGAWSRVSQLASEVGEMIHAQSEAKGSKVQMLRAQSEHQVLRRSAGNSKEFASKRRFGRPGSFKQSSEMLYNFMTEPPPTTLNSANESMLSESEPAGTEEYADSSHRRRFSLNRFRRSSSMGTSSSQVDSIVSKSSHGSQKKETPKKKDNGCTPTNTHVEFNGNETSRPSSMKSVRSFASSNASRENKSSLNIRSPKKKKDRLSNSNHTEIGPSSVRSMRSILSLASSNASRETKNGILISEPFSATSSSPLSLNAKKPKRRISFRKLSLSSKSSHGSTKKESKIKKMDLLSASLHTDMDEYQQQKPSRASLRNMLSFKHSSPKRK